MPSKTKSQTSIEKSLSDAFAMFKCPEAVLWFRSGEWRLLTVVLSQCCSRKLVINSTECLCRISAMITASDFAILTATETHQGPILHL